jgi:hypothetical protein
MAKEAISMKFLVRTRQVALILIAVPIAWMTVQVSWLIVHQVVQSVVTKVVETAATSL